MRRSICLLILPWMLVAGAAAAAPIAGPVLEKESAQAAPRTATDPVCLYYEDFQNGPAGWVAKDVTQYPTDHDPLWHHVIVNDGTEWAGGAMFCGKEDPSYPGSLGYGNNWDQHLSKTFTLPSSGGVLLEYVVRTKTEGGFDDLLVEISNDDGVSWVDLDRFSGDSEYSECYEYWSGAQQPPCGQDGWLAPRINEVGVPLRRRDLSDYAGQTVIIRFRFSSDHGYSDEDGLFDGDGVWITRVQVSGYPADDFNAGNDGWVASRPWNRVDGGFRLVAEPACLPSPAPPCDMYCNAWVAYDPATGVFPFSQGLPPYDKALANMRFAIESPVIEIPADATNYYLDFDVFAHLPLDNAVFYNYEIAAPAPEYGGTFKGFPGVSLGSGHVRRHFDITNKMQPGATTMKIRLSGVDMLGSLGGSGAAHTPAPFFDNVAVTALGTSAPGIDCGGYPRYCNYGYTGTGNDVAVSPLDATSGTRPVTVEFDAVVGDGTTTVTTSGSGPPPPSGFRLGAPPIYYEVETTATYSGLIEVCIDYSGVSFANESRLRLLHQEGGPWVDRTSSLDADADRICGLVPSLSPFLVCEEVSEGHLSGSVVADCPDPGTPLLGVTVDAFELGTGLLVGTAVTDANGQWSIPSLSAGQYTVTLVTPLAYAANGEEIVATVAGGDTVVADFDLACLGVTREPRSVGFWKHQVGVATGGSGNAQIDGATLCGYLDLIESHFNNNQVNPIVVYEPPASGLCADKLEAAKALLNLSGSVAMERRAKQHFMGLLLNVASGKLSLLAAASNDGATVSQAVTYCDQLLHDAHTSNDETAKDIADAINSGRSLAAGTIPLSTPDIAYAPGGSGPALPRALVLEQNHPNPFNPTTTIRFALPRSGLVRLAVFDVTGRLVRRLLHESRSGGVHELRWEGTGDDGRTVAAGTYWLRLEANGEVRSTRMVVLK